MSSLHLGIENRIVDTEVNDIGRLSSERWDGPVSADELIENKEVSLENIDSAISNIDSFYISVGTAALTRCIDGRHDPDLMESNLGPQVPGGVAGAALAHKIGVDSGDARGGSFLTDANFMIKKFLRHNLSLGGHRDEHSENTDSVGCGAIDAMHKAVEAMANPDLHHDHKELVVEIMGTDTSSDIHFDRDIYMRNMGIAGFVHASSESYFRGREAIMDTLDKHQPGGSVPILKGQHKECLFVVNMVPNETLSSNRFAEEHDGMQAFGYDVWRSVQMAETILPGRDQELDRRRFITARIMTTIATLMALTDGSQRLVIRRPVYEEEK
jgi:hypothetical protein